MAFLINRNRWRIKPGPRVELDHHQPSVKGLAGCWLFNGVGSSAANGTVRDLVGAHHGTITDTTTIDRQESRVGRNMSFTGDNSDHRIDLGPVDASDPLALSDSNATLLFEIFIRSGGVGSTAPRIIDKSDGGAGQNGWYLAFNPNQLEFSHDSNFHNMGDSVPRETWVIPAFVQSGTDYVRYYEPVIGEYKQKTSGIGSIAAVTTNAAIGNWNHSTDRNWHGAISFIYVWNRAMDEHEVRDLQAAPYAMFRPRATRTFYLPPVLRVAPPPPSTTRRPIVMAITT